MDSMPTTFLPYQAPQGLYQPHPQQQPTRTTVSDNPDDYHSHFIQLTPKTNKGQARYRCVTCHHEFSCSGKRRKLQHILGKDYLIGKCKNRNVVPCRYPHEPLKRALLKICLAEGESNNVSRLSSASSSFHFESPSLTNQGPAAMIMDQPATTNQSHPHHDPEFSSVLEDILNWENDLVDDDLTDTPFSSSSGSSDEGDEGTQTPKRMRRSLADSPFSPQSSFYDHPHRESPVTVRAPLSFAPTTTTTTNTATSNSNNPLGAFEFPPLETISFSNYTQMASRQNLNRAILNFFFAYQIPLQALESDSFQSLLSQIHHNEVPNIVSSGPSPTAIQMGGLPHAQASFQGQVHPPHPTQQQQQQPFHLN